MKKILVPVDFSDITTEVLDYAVQIANEEEGSITVLHVASPTPIFPSQDAEPGMIQTYVEEELTREKEELEAITEHIKKQGIEADSILLQGSIIDTIIDEANELHADMIVMGKESHGLLYRTLLGTTSEGVIRRTHVPVLIIPER
ncbi:MAG: universal stress protein [Bacteroidota bacterium]|nr:universal stress protein [Bacteroidota bacterium]